MFDKWRKYSYADQKKQRHRMGSFLLWILLFFVLYLSLTTFIFSVRVLENDTMQPGLRMGDRFVFSSFMVYTLLPDIDLLSQALPIRRGNIVLVDMPRNEKRSVLTSILDGGLRFFTAQKISLADREKDFYIKRVIGLPGDEITMTNFVLRVRPGGEQYNLTEFELSESPYDVTIPQVPALWDSSIPFSGNMDRIVLGENECFVLSDDRSNTNDSRTWGPIPIDFIAGKALFRYWPLNRMSRF
jgi:signal peptidase I